MHTGRGARCVALLLFASPLMAQADDRVRDAMAVVGMDASSADIVAYCESNAAAAAPPMRSAWQAWRTRNAVDDVAATLSAAQRGRLRDNLASTMAATRERMRGLGPASKVCVELTTMWSGDSFDVRRLHPLAYGSPSATPSGAAPPRPQAPMPSNDGTAMGPQPRGAFNSEYWAIPARPTGTVHTAAQLSALVDQWLGTPRNYPRARTAMRAAMPLYLRAKVIQRGERFYFESNDGEFASRWTIAPSIGLGPFVGQEITLEATMDELPMSMVFLKKTRVVRDPSGLRPSTLPEAPGLRRMQVPVARITAPAGRGLRAADIRGMHYRGYGTTGSSGYEFREELRLLLTDGWAYLREDVAPADLDVAASRRLEPQQWARWRVRGSEYEFQRQDDHGQPDGDWAQKPGRVLQGWPTGHRLEGGYTSAAFNGSLALGGVYSTSTFRFLPDGRYERASFARGSSGTMAAQAPGEFSASASSSSDGSGTRGSAGGGSPGVFSGATTRRDDGARNRGTYRLDGMTLELRTDAGETFRLLCIPVAPDFTRFYLLGRSFSRK